MNYWHGDNPNCGRCGNLNERGFCGLTACAFPAICESGTLFVKSQTNADRIRAMTDKELAEFLYIKTCEDGYPQFDNIPRWLDWLKQEAKE